MARRLVVVAALLMAGAAMAEEAAATAPKARLPLEVSVGVSQLTQLSFFRTSPGLTALDVAVELPLSGSAWVVGAGLRLTVPSERTPVPLEGFIEAGLRGHAGAWEPTCMLELGVSGLADLGWDRAGLPDDLYTVEQSRVSPLFLAFAAAPLRFRWDRWLVSALELRAGPTLAPIGASARLQVTILRLGVSL